MKSERRKARRVGLRWPILLSGHAIGRVETRTENLSSGGFYCILENALAPGERLDCEVTVPRDGRGPAGEVVGSIRCQAEVLRVEALGMVPGFGVACKILDFTFAENPRSFNAGPYSH